MKYLENLRKNDKELQNKIETLLEKHQSYPVGSGYIDIITKYELSEKLIEEISNAGIAINAVTWWCHCSDENKKNMVVLMAWAGPSAPAVMDIIVRWGLITKLLKLLKVNTTICRQV